MSDLPSDWLSVRLMNVAVRFISGGTPSSQRRDFWDGTIPWTTSAPIHESDLRLSKAQRLITAAGLQNSSTNLVPQGSLLVGTRVGVGKAVVNDLDVAISQDLTGVLLDGSRADAEFLAYQFKTRAIRAFVGGRKRGTTIQGISRFDLQSIEFLLPPLPEQRAIVAALRTIQDARDARRRELALERERKAALMEDLFTYGIRKDGAIHLTDYGSLPTRWAVKPLAECASVQTGAAKGRDFKGAAVREVPYLRVANVQDGYLDLTEMKNIMIRESEINRFCLQDGDVVLTEGGDFDKLGRGFVWSGQIPGCIHQNHVFAVRGHRGLVLPHFLAYLVASPYGKAYFLAVAHKTTNLACINATKLKAFPVPLPPLDEQCDIAEVLTVSDRKIAALESEAAVQDELFRALLEELMTGRLSALPLVEMETPDTDQIGA